MLDRIPIHAAVRRICRVSEGTSLRSIVHTHTHTHTRARAHTHTNTQTHIHIHTYTHTSLFSICDVLVPPPPPVRQNFVLSVSDAQYAEHMAKEDGSLTFLGRLDEQLNLLFTVLFAAELFVNLYANWFQTFARNGWNW
jgi:hypothetical protein